MRTELEVVRFPQAVVRNGENGSGYSREKAKILLTFRTSAFYNNGKFETARIEKKLLENHDNNNNSCEYA